jgi:Tfp pilus assembly protein PilF
MNEYFLKEITEVNTQTLDSAVKEVEQLYPNVAEIIKLDTQGAEYLILQGGKKVLKSQCMILVCEVHFRHIYKNIKLFSEIDQFLSKEGFVLFDLVPLVTFAHQMDGRGILGPQERFMAADAYYILDPLEQRTKNLRFSERSIKVLILGAILLKYFRFAYQLIQKFIKNNTEKTRLINLVECLSMDQAMDQKCNAFIQQARFYLQGQRYKEAEEKLKEALSLNPTFNTLTSINYALASLYERKGDLKRAKEKFREVIESARGVPSFVGGAHFHLGCIHKRMGNIKKAKHHFEECLKFIPDHGEAWKALRSIYPPRKQS